ncbi:NAD(P)-dependent oxidoreductase [Solibacillus sp. FSL W7-1436]|uniref:NAD(P)-dependent oxidoreductase n=1 Tax=Solibacillus sp. FSL W7-1436 TaxID=2921705 RepID=UPI0030F81E08
MPMMTERWLVIGTDERMKFLAKQLSTNDRTVYYKNTTVWDEALNKVALELHPTEIVLPIHPLSIQVEELLGIRQARFFAGKLTDQWKQILENKRLHYYLEDETFIWKNAALTAEGFLAHLYKEKVNVQYKTIMITGFGRVAKMLALFLTRLNAKVIIAVRSEAQKAEALAYGYQGIELNEKNIMEADFLINTIPTKWLTKDYESWIIRPIYDVASSPGCLNDFKLSQYELLPALPGKYFPQAAANLLYETILELRKEEANA